MSNVQCPTSGSEDGTFLRDRPDIGHWTLDVGLLVRDLRKSYESPGGDRIEVLRSVSFSVSPGEAVAIIGPSGTGKSTLLNLLGGLDSPDHGSISFEQFAINSASPATLARFRNQRLGFIFQFHHLMLDLTAAENVGLPLMIRRASRSTALARACEVLEQAGLLDRRDHLVSHLSGGEQQRVAVCRALVTLPSLVLADEPTGNLDTVNGDIVARSLTEYARKNGSVVVIATHNQKLATLCDRTLELQNGRLSSH
ncbi:MAG TPA: ABC transporter ATP-binding protein [Pyrinomonadaceae bacterium]